MPSRSIASELCAPSPPVRQVDVRRFAYTILLSVAVLGALGAPTVPKFDELVPEATLMREIDTNTLTREGDDHHEEQDHGGREGPDHGGREDDDHHEKQDHKTTAAARTMATTRSKTTAAARTKTMAAARGDGHHEKQDHGGREDPNHGGREDDDHGGKWSHNVNSP